MAEQKKPEPESMGLGDEEQIETPLPEIEETEERAETPTLSAKEIEAIRKQARKEVEAEFKKKLRDKALAAEKDKARADLSVHENAHLNGVLSDPVRITIDIPEFSNTPWITVDMGGKVKTYLHGQTYTVPRHVGNSLREQMQWMRRHQNEIDGKKRNRHLADGRFVDVVTGKVTKQHGEQLSAATAAATARDAAA